MINKEITVEMLNQTSVPNMANHLGIEFTELGTDYVCARMPVDHRTRQPYGILHGGASVVLAETLGSLGASLCVDLSQFKVVGLEINANHIRPVSEGYVYGRAEILHLGRSTQIWEIKITNKEGKLVCISRLTIAVLPL